jgi:uncharacterized protein YdeI (YjbR/CyaY-like superfamily)
MNPKVDFYFNKAGKWQEELQQLRRIVLDCGLIEELKWGVPCYALPSSGEKKKNVVLIHDFKEYCALLFVKGSLMKDTHGILIQQTENVQAARQVRFAGVREIAELEPVLKAYVYEAAEVEKAGLKVPMKKTEAFAMPEEFRKQLDADAGLKAAFEALTPGRQRGYLLYFSQAKQAKTRESRIEKYIPHIRSGKGLDDV